jgi:hypothetical protein
VYAFTRPGGLPPFPSGIRTCSADDLPHWLGEELWRAEPDGENVRLLERIDRWDPESARAFGRACAERARGHAVDELRGLSLAEEADELARASSLPEIAEAAGALRSNPVTYAAMTTALHAAAALETPRFVSWMAFAGYGAAVTAGHRDPVSGAARERQLQATWLADRLGLL